MASVKSPGHEQELPSYWRRTSPSALSHVVKTPQHAIIAALCAGSFAGFSFALVQQKPFDGGLAGVAVLLCLYIYTMQSERCRRKSELREAFVGVSVESASKGGRGGGAGARAVAEGTSELDLTGYAKTLGMSIRNGVVHKEGGTLNKILMDALAKEYLRCVTALRWYQTTFGPLPEEDSIAATHDSSVPESSRHDPLSTTLNTLNIGLDSLEESAAPTPRSPPGPPSPDPKRCRSTSENQVSSAPQGSPAPAAPTNTPATALLDSAKAGSSIVNVDDPGAFQSDIQDERTVSQTFSSAMWNLDEVKSAALTFQESSSEAQSGNGEAQKSPQRGFGLFGSRRTDSL